jgi:hypothetical protein
LKIGSVPLGAAALFALVGCSSPDLTAGGGSLTPPPATTSPTGKPAAPTAVAAQASPTAGLPAAPTLAIAASPIAPSPSPAATAAGVPESSADGRTYPGPFYLGLADAPVTIDEYADFQ